MKKLIVFAICLSAMVACNQGKKSEDLTVMQLRDSLDRVISQKDNEINDMMSTMNDIEEGFRAISAAENRVSVARKGEGASMKERIISDNIYMLEFLEFFFLANEITLKNFYRF